MSLAAVLYPPPTKQGWREWSFANFNHHQAIDAAIVDVLGVAAQHYRIWPVDESNFDDWLEQHQLSHSLYNQILGIDGQDLTGLDLKDKNKREGWFFIHYIQHQAAAQILKLPTL